MCPEITRVVTFGMLLAGISAANATVIWHDLDHLGADQWRYRYSIENDSLSEPIRALTIYFNQTPSIASPADIGSLLREGELASLMDELIELAGSGGTSDGLRATGANGTGVAQGVIAGTLVAEFTWSGQTPPGAQFFEVFRCTDLNNCNPDSVIDSGYTTPMVEPTTLALLGLGLAGLRFSRRRA
jgi:hypothetical protein